MAASKRAERRSPRTWASASASPHAAGALPGTRTCRRQAKSAWAAGWARLSSASVEARECRGLVDGIDLDQAPARNFKVASLAPPGTQWHAWVDFSPGSPCPILFRPFTQPSHPLRVHQQARSRGLGRDPASWPPGYRNALAGRSASPSPSAPSGRGQRGNGHGKQCLSSLAMALVAMDVRGCWASPNPHRW
jgi:hypothetical protein